ncbi:hypothetical protein [Kordiimonas aquimaris]|uniref:hypothetical protein n=1 Tax=Kordiimonas aquimaris TaxID=707591 RepID=UPI0021D12D90|nr:hypothetical protein [Kordiimonas aquimaris]
MFSRFISRVMPLAGIGLLMLSAPSHAQTVGIDVTSDIGTFQPVALGEDISLSPCGSNIVRGNGAFISSLCDTGSPDAFSVNYLISFGGTTSALSFGTGANGVSAGVAALVAGAGGVVLSQGATAGALSSPLTLATGVGSLFSTAGTYVISLIISVRNGGTINVANGPNQRPFGDGGLELANTGFTINGASVGNFDGTVIGTLGGNVPATANGSRNVAFSQATIVVEAASVPEPSSIVMLLMALISISYFHHNRSTITRSNS